MTGLRPLLVVHRETEHGVARYARDLAVTLAPWTGAPAVDAERLEAMQDSTIHLQFTDRLWGATPEAAAARVRELARRHRLVLTLHDLPQPSDGSRLARRVACYRSVCHSAHAVIVNSRHERDLLAEHVDAAVLAHVIPLPVDRTPGYAAAGPREPVDDIAVLGFFYPGKGHTEAVEVAAQLGIRQVTVLGRSSPGHERELEDLVRAAARSGVHLEVTGFLPDGELLERCRASGVPLLAHRHLSASGSLTSWLAAGRRPIAVDGRYMREMAALRPGTLALTSVGELAATVAAARADPGLTRLPPDHPRDWDSADVAASHLALWRSL